MVDESSRTVSRRTFVVGTTSLLTTASGTALAHGDSHKENASDAISVTVPIGEESYVLDNGFKPNKTSIPVGLSWAGKDNFFDLNPFGTDSLSYPFTVELVEVKQADSDSEATFSVADSFEWRPIKKDDDVVVELFPDSPSAHHNVRITNQSQSGSGIAGAVNRFLGNGSVSVDVVVGDQKT